MEITTLSDLLKDGSVKEISRGISVEVCPSMIIEGEDRLSYTTIIRLVECSREHHWQTDVLQLAQNKQLDSICKSLSADFKKPIFVGSRIQITYSITEVRRKSYRLSFHVNAEGTDYQHAVVDMLCVFYDPTTRKAASPPPPVMNHLTEIQENRGSHT